MDISQGRRTTLAVAVCMDPLHKPVEPDTVNTVRRAGNPGHDTLPSVVVPLDHVLVLVGTPDRDERPSIIRLPAYEGETDIPQGDVLEPISDHVDPPVKDQYRKFAGVSGGKSSDIKLQYIRS